MNSDKLINFLKERSHQEFRKSILNGTFFFELGIVKKEENNEFKKKPEASD